MSFNWESFCKAHGIHYVTEGSSWTPGNINIHCPYCGDADPGQHMGLHVDKGFWHCWRNDSHAGKRPHRLIMQLIGCTLDEANAHVGGQEVSLEGFDKAAAQFLALGKNTGSHRTLELPPEFKPLTSFKGRAKIYAQYLVNRRRFEEYDIGPLHEKYDLHYCDKGRWRGRVIMPIYLDGKLVSWTGRTVYDSEPVRYRSLSHKEDADPRGLTSVREVLYNYDNVMSQKRWHAGILVEGPLDVLKLDFFGEEYDICAFCPFGTGIGKSQLWYLKQIARRCDNMYICADKGAQLNQLKLSSATVELGLKDLPLPSKVEDPGALTVNQAYRVLQNL